MKQTTYSLILWILLFLFTLRVLGQIMVSFFTVPSLPAFNSWYSGLLPYPYLLLSQILILALFTKFCVDISKNKGYFIQHNLNGNYLVGFGIIYFVSMIARIIFWNLSIPAIFHMVLASFIIIVGLFYKDRRMKRK